VVDLADDTGSTAHIIQEIESAPSGARWAVGTEARLVNRLKSQHPQQEIVALASVPPFCRTMSQITLASMETLLSGLAEGAIANEVTVQPDTTHWARRALERMLAV
jgi:quinolinate synthase